MALRVLCKHEFSLIRHDVPGLADHNLGDVFHSRCLNDDLSVEGVGRTSYQHAIDATVRSSLILFSIAFTSSSIESVWPSSLDRWTLQNRRWMGLSFASSHFIHLGLIISMTVLFPDPFVNNQSMAQWVFGGLASGFVFLMALTSTEQAQRWMGMKNWKRLYFVGSHWIWKRFFYSHR